MRRWSLLWCCRPNGKHHGKLKHLAQSLCTNRKNSELESTPASPFLMSFLLISRKLDCYLNAFTTLGNSSRLGKSSSSSLKADQLWDAFRSLWASWPSWNNHIPHPQLAVNVWLCFHTSYLQILWSFKKQQLSPDIVSAATIVLCWQYHGLLANVIVYIREKKSHHKFLGCSQSLEKTVSDSA